MAKKLHSKSGHASAWELFILVKSSSIKDDELLKWLADNIENNCEASLSIRNQV